MCIEYNVIDNDEYKMNVIRKKIINKYFHFLNFNNNVGPLST